MHKHIQYIFIALLFLFIYSCKKDLLHLQKVSQLSSGTSSRLSKVRFINDSLCIITGGVKYQRSDILRSADGGHTFTDYSSAAAPKGMYASTVSPDGTIFLCGIDGIVLTSKDAGKTWQFNRIGNWLFYTALAFPTNDTGIFINSIGVDTGHVTETDTNLNIISQHTFLFALNDIQMINPSTGYIIGYGAVLKTTDYRRSWQFQDAKNDNFTCMDIHGGEIWMCGYNGSILHTSNAGTSWQKLRNGNDITLPRYHLYSLCFKDKLHGWATGEEGKVIYTDDGGKHWSEYDNFTHSTLRCITLCPNGDLLVAGDNGVLFRITP